MRILLFHFLELRVFPTFFFEPLSIFLLRKKRHLGIVKASLRAIMTQNHYP